jgi:thioredoxin-related protein
MRFLATFLKSLFMIILINNVVCANEQPMNFPQAMNLEKTGQVARNKHSPVVLVVISDSCPYCKRLEEEVLRPLMISGDYVDRIQLQILNKDQHNYRVDFDGVQRSPDSIADRYRIRLVPTVLLLGPDGEELAERLVGINVIDYYWAYLDQAIEQARARLLSGS